MPCFLFDIFNASNAACFVDSIWSKDGFLVKLALVVFWPIPEIQIGSSENFLQVFSEVNKIEADPVHGLEQSSNFKSSVSFLEFNTSSMDTSFCVSAYGLFNDSLWFFTDTIARSSSFIENFLL